MPVKIEYDERKRVWTKETRGLDFAEASLIFGGIAATAPDDRRDYGEKRFITIGFVHDDLVVVVWTPRGDSRRVISMRKANEREKERFFKVLSRP